MKRNMEIYATVHKSVYINPLDVIRNLFQKEVGLEYQDVVLGENEKGYYYEYEEYKFSKTKEYVTKDVYEYLKSLEIVAKKLENE